MPEVTFPGIRFEEAIDYLRDRLALEPGEFAALLREADAAATDRAAGMRDALVKDITQAILDALEEGTTAADFRATFGELTRAHGWSAGEEAGVPASEGDSPKLKGGADNGFETAWRADLTFRTMTAQAVAAGRWRQIQRLKSTRPWLRYVTAGDHRVRDAHKAWHGVILHCDDPWWDTHYPPNGFNCRCFVQQLSDADLVRYGLSVSEAAPPARIVIKFVRGPDGAKRPVEVPAGIDPGFAVNWGEIGLRLAPGAGVQAP